MSRHRAVRNIDIDDELEMDEAMDDVDEMDDMTAEQQAQMNDGMTQLDSILGKDSGIDDQERKQALWDYYFDVESALSHLLEQKHKREQRIQKDAEKRKIASAKNSRPATPTKQQSQQARAASPTKASSSKQKLTVPAPVPAVSQLRQDLEGMNLVSPSSSSTSSAAPSGSSTPTYKPKDREKILAEIKAAKVERPVLSLVVVGHVDAGKSTLMGRLLHELGETTDRAFEANQRAANKIGKGSFAYAWTFDALDEERERGVTIDVTVDHFETPHRSFTLIDAPGHRDFIPNMISGAAQADVAILVVDATKGAFEAGFERDGQTREHAILVRSLGTREIVVVVNKLDTADYAQARFEDIKSKLEPFLSATGFQAGKVKFVPVAAMSGENLTDRSDERLKGWYEGPTLVQALDSLEVPQRAIEAPLRIPVSNVFRGVSATASGLGVSGRVESGIVQLGERLAALPGDESGVVKSIEVDGESRSYATAGVNVTLFLSGIDQVQVSVGSVLCPIDNKVPVSSSFSAQIVVFEPKVPVTVGSMVELYHHSKDIPASIVALEALLDKQTGQIIKHNPRLLTKGAQAKVKVQLKGLPTASASGTGTSGGIPIEPFAKNKSMGRVLFRRNGETIAAGIVLEVL